MKRLAHEIIKGKNLKENLPEFSRGMMEIYSEYSFIRLAMNYFTYYGMIADGGKRDEQLEEIGSAFNNIIKKVASDELPDNETEALLTATEAIRGQVINIMKGLTSYVDIFNIYEYCLNRVEYRFKESDENLIKSNEELTEELLTYILSDKDNIVINSKIAEIVRQLPVRMTKNKFFELLTAGIGIYKGSEISSVEDYLFMLKTNAMIEISPYTELTLEDVGLIYRELLGVSFTDITEERYNDLRQKADFAVLCLKHSISIYMTMGELINDVYVILLSKKYASNASENEKPCKAIIKNVADMIDDSDSNNIISDEEYDKAAESFTELEGKQETLFMKLSSYENVAEQALDEYEDILISLGLKEEYTALKRMSAFESGSTFMEFSEKNTNPADEGYISMVTDKLIGEFKDFFKNHEKLVNRAVMAHTLSGLPVFFNNIDEIKDYIYVSLNQCSDLAERTAVTEIMEILMNEEQ